MVTPTLLRRNVRREMCFLVMNMSAVSLRHSHLKRCAVDDAGNERRKPVVLAGGLPDDRSDDGHVGVLETSSERVRKQHFGGRAGELVGTGENRAAQPGRPVDRR